MLLFSQTSPPQSSNVPASAVAAVVNGGFGSVVLGTDCCVTGVVIFDVLLVLLVSAGGEIVEEFIVSKGDVVFEILSFSPRELLDCIDIGTELESVCAKAEGTN